MFYLLAAVSVISALLVVFARNPIHSVLYLIVTFFAIAGQYILLNAQFLAVVHIIVYAGAIMVLFLFVLMLLNLNKDTEPRKDMILKGVGVVAGGMLFITLLASLKGASDITANGLVDSNNGLVKNLGQVLFKDFVVPFEISSILFLAAMAGAVMIGKKEAHEDEDTIAS
jgi:NADH-quinone oxidoreductase subunit J